jgi:hypothetical protein
MKKSIKFLAMAVVMLTFASNIFAQTANANASATIITPISITFGADMNFGSASVTAVPGTIQMTPAAVRTASGGVALSAIAPVAAAASFTVNGAANATYTIAIAPAVLTISNGANTMTVDTWQTNPTPTGTLSGAGSQVLTVGATLHVAGSQAVGLYTSAAPFTVTVGYN